MIELQDTSPTFKSIMSSIDGVMTETFVDITGMIFKYDKAWFNKTIFKDYLGLELDDKMTHEVFLNTLQIRLKIKKAEFQAIVDDFTHIDTGKIDGAMIEYVGMNIWKLLLFFDLLERYIIIESWKIDCFKDNRPSDFEVQSIVNGIKNIEKDIFWKEVIERPITAKAALVYIQQHYQLNKELLDLEQREFMENLLWKLQCSDFAVEEDSSTHVEVKNETNILKDPLGWKDTNKEILETNISRDEYIKIFELAIAILWIEGMKVYIVSDTNISVTQSRLNIPDTQEYAFLPISRIISLIAHELEKHAIWSRNNQNFIGNMTSMTYLAQEEGMAHVFEHLALGYNLEEIPMNRYLPRMLVWEIVSGKDFERFLGIMDILDGQELVKKWFFLRAKRWKDLVIPWVNPKEKLYWIGALDVIEDLKNWVNPLIFFLTMTSRDEQSIVSDSLNLENPIQALSSLRQKKTIFPLFLWELLRYKLIQKPNSDIMNPSLIHGFIKYFVDRYGELFQQSWINYRILIKNFVSNMQKENTERVNQIFTILSESK